MFCSDIQPSHNDRKGNTTGATAVRVYLCQSHGDGGSKRLLCLQNNFLNMRCGVIVMSVLMVIMIPGLTLTCLLFLDFMLQMVKLNYTV